MKYYIIVNPTSGRGLGEKSIPHIESSLQKSGLDFTLVQTERVWHASELAENAVREGYDVMSYNEAEVRRILPTARHIVRVLAEGIEHEEQYAAR